jgi:hypothetical protein
VSAAAAWQAAPPDPQQLTPSDEQIGETTGDSRRRGVLHQPAVATLASPNNRLITPVLRSTLVRGLGSVLATLDLVDNAAKAIASVGEVSGAGAHRRIVTFRPRYA